MPDLRLIEAGGAAASISKQTKGKPRRTKGQRETIRNAKRVMQAEAQIDADLSRAIDAIAFLSRNELDPAPLIARISPMEAEVVAANLKKAVDWINRFAEGWHVFTSNFEAENASSGTSFEAARGGGIRLVSRRD